MKKKNNKQGRKQELSKGWQNLKRTTNMFTPTRTEKPKEWAKLWIISNLWSILATIYVANSHGALASLTSWKYCIYITLKPFIAPPWVHPCITLSVHNAYQRLCIAASDIILMKFENKYISKIYSWNSKKNVQFHILGISLIHNNFDLRYIW